MPTFASIRLITDEAASITVITPTTVAIPITIAMANIVECR